MNYLLFQFRKDEERGLDFFFEFGLAPLRLFLRRQHLCGFGVEREGEGEGERGRESVICI